MPHHAFVTGGTGYIGSHVVRRLVTAGWRVTMLVRDRPGGDDAVARPHGADLEPLGTIADLTALFARARPDIVIHLASAIVQDHRADDVDVIVDTNIGLPCRLLEAMRAGGCRRFLNTGTFWQHRHGDARHAPVNLYAASKQAFEAMLRHYTDAQGMSAITLKLFETYGRDTRRKLIPLLLETLNGAPLSLSPGDQTIDLTHVEDVAEAFYVAALRLLEPPTSEECFFVSGERMTVKELVRLIEGIHGRPLDVVFGGRPYRDREIMVPIDATGMILPNWVRTHDVAGEIRAALAQRR